MATPCKKCGAEKTEDVRRGMLYSLAKFLGYRLRMCSRCRRLRLLPRHGERPRPATEPELEPAPLPPTPSPKGACPKCGKTDYRRSRRRSWERLLQRGPMVRCRACQARFPVPRPDESDN